MNKLELLKSISFGEQIAEEEISELAKYFVETDQWSRIVKGEIDIVRGDKGSGKSAIYSLLITRETEFFDQRTLLVAGERPRGAPVFKDIISNPPTTEPEFVGLWKLYLLAIIAQKMREWEIKGEAANKLYSALEAARLLEREYDLAGLLRAASDLARRLLKAESVEGGLKVDSATGLPNGITAKITFREPSPTLRDQGYVSADRLIFYANHALADAKMRIWILLDRLDVAFAENHELERNALRALFKVYRDLTEHSAIKLKIFLRSDIWGRISEGGFREASHITKFAVLDWKQESLLNLVIRRLISNESLVSALKIDRDKTLNDFSAQIELFYRLFPSKVDQGAKRPSTLDWMISRCADGKKSTVPRELIHLLTSLKEKEISRLELGEPPAPGEQLFDRSVFKEALTIVSETRYQQYLIAEYPDLKKYLSRLKGDKTEQTADSLASIWEIQRDEAETQAMKLVEIGFFELRGEKNKQTFWVPFLFRDALSMSQGLAD